LRRTWGQRDQTGGPVRGRVHAARKEGVGAPDHFPTPLNAGQKASETGLVFQALGWTGGREMS
jgi:hypothetical protein